ncbi:MAG: CopG family ribbon-helix-helix protein [Candidatus Aramenus sp.]|jgi:CopG family nickel-responsive transcriptional regulator|nr:CopG family ribbon-helix-helix protein [Candidatus Aramenus sp.]
MNVEKLSVSLPKELVQELNKFMEKNAIGDRSKIFQIALRNFLDENEKDNAVVYGIINVVYDEHEASWDFLELQHEYLDKIISTMHLHLNERDCMEAIAVRGTRSELVNLNSKLSQIRGVKKSRLLISYEVR